MRAALVAAACVRGIRKAVVAKFAQFATSLVVVSATITLSHAESLSAVFRFYNLNTGAHFYTINPAERDAARSSLPQFRYEGPAFYAYSTPGADRYPVYRFYNTQTLAHFYTIDPAERDSVVANYKQFSYEGPVWYARTAAGAGATALYRFYRTTNNAHFYTPDPSERDYVRNNLGDFRYEGPAYFVWLNQDPGARPGQISSIDDALEELNRIRVAAGVNPLARNAQAAAAANSHAVYMVTSALAGEDAHTERVGAANFTGIDVAARLKAAGYPTPTSSVAEVASGTSLGTSIADPTTLVRSLMNAPYHGLAMLSGHRDAGIGFQSGNHTVVVVDMASWGGAYLSVPPLTMRMSPCNGIDNILNRSLQDESPAPIAGRNIGTDPIGTPIYVAVQESSVLTLTSYEVRNLLTNEVAPIAKVLGDDPADRVAASKRAILPNRPLAVGAPYRATVTGLNNGVSFSKSCDFTTGD